MRPETLEKIIKPLDKLLNSHGFTLEGEPLWVDNTKMATFKGPKGDAVDYSLKIAMDKGTNKWNSRSIVDFSMDVVRENKRTTLYSTGGIVNPNSAESVIKEIVARHVRSYMEEHYKPQN